MTGYWDDRATIERRIWRGLLVQEFGPEDVDALDYIAAAKRRQSGSA
jgi:hypothetical protein